MSARPPEDLLAEQISARRAARVAPNETLRAD
jgi:hypothetical protein